MTFFDVILIGVALAMDAFALTVSNCTAYKDSIGKVKGWAMPSAFGFFQFLMPVIGFYVGSIFANSISSAAGLITSAVFFILFLKIIVDNVKEMRAEKIIAPSSAKNTETRPPFNLKLLFVQAIATSIDAFLIGATEFAFNLSSPFWYALIVGATTFLIVSVALFIGKSLGKLLGNFATWAGAALLLALAVKELLQAVL